MALMDFIKKQFIDIIQWTETGDGTLAWRFPMADMEIQNGASLTVRESQIAVFVNEGKVADVFGPGMYKLTTQTLPVLTYLKNWDKLFESPFKSDVYFFSTRQQVDQQMGHAAADHHPRQGLRRGAAARLRQLQLPHRRCQAVPHRDLRHARHLLVGRPRRPAARPGAAEHQRRDRSQRRALSSTWRPTRSSSRRRSHASWCRSSQASASSSRPSRSRTSRCRKNCRRSSTRRSAWAWSATTWASSCSTRPAQAIPEVRRGRRQRRWRHRRRCDGPGRRRRAGPGAGAEPRAGAQPEPAAAQRGTGASSSRASPSSVRPT